MQWISAIERALPWPFTAGISAARQARVPVVTGQVPVLADEDREAFNRFSDGMIRSLAPEGEVELQLAHRIVKDHWRLNRASALEDNLFALGDAQHRHSIRAHDPQAHAALTAARTFAQEGKQFQLITLYEQRINRTLHKNIALLRELQTERKAIREARMKEAQLLLQVSAINGLTYEPAKDGFVFSSAEIVAALDRSHRLEEARDMQRQPRLARAA